MYYHSISELDLMVLSSYVLKQMVLILSYTPNVSPPIRSVCLDFYIAFTFEGSFLVMNVGLCAVIRKLFCQPVVCQRIVWFDWKWKHEQSHTFFIDV